MKAYKVLVHNDIYQKVAAYLETRKTGKGLGQYLQIALKEQDISQIAVEKFIQILVRTKRPQIFAESEVFGDGSDWTQEELSILGDITIATPVTVFDNGRHHSPFVYSHPFKATLLFVPGALLRNETNNPPADWEEVTNNGNIDPDAYDQLYERRLLPSFMYANEIAKKNGIMALITLPGLGCGQFAGKFNGQLGEMLKNALKTFLTKHGNAFSNIKAVYYDPYQECDNERHEIYGTSLMVRPLTKGNDDKPQLCHPKHYEEAGDDFADCALYSFVAWDHVSWPGNDFYLGSRVTDDGVKAAATNAMTAITGIEGEYDAQRNQYKPPTPYRNWEAVVVANEIQLDVISNLILFP